MFAKFFHENRLLYENPNKGPETTSTSPEKKESVSDSLSAQQDLFKAKISETKTLIKDVNQLIPDFEKVVLENKDFKRLLEMDPEKYDAQYFEYDMQVADRLIDFCNLQLTVDRTKLVVSDQESKIASEIQIKDFISNLPEDISNRINIVAEGDKITMTFKEDQKDSRTVNFDASNFKISKVATNYYALSDGVNTVKINFSYGSLNYKEETQNGRKEISITGNLKLPEVETEEKKPEEKAPTKLSAKELKKLVKENKEKAPKLTDALSELGFAGCNFEALENGNFQFNSTEKPIFSAEFSSNMQIEQDKRFKNNYIVSDESQSMELKNVAGKFIIKMNGETHM